MAVFNAYIDEAGDEGFVTVQTPQAGSSEWFVLAAVLVPGEDDLALSHAADDVRALLGKPPPKPLHFRKLKHPARRAAMARLAQYPFVVSCVALWKPGITSSFLRTPPHLYNYGCRFLIERLSWYAGDRGRQLNLFFENRASTSYAALQGYMQWIQNDPSCTIRRGTVGSFVPINANVKLVQVADFYASACASAFEPNVYGLAEESYLMAVRHQLYRGAGGLFGTGLKIFPDGGHNQARYPWLASI